MSALVPINNVSVNFEVIGEVVFADTLKISEVFEKQHRDVLKIIRALPDDEFKSLNFQPSTYLDAQMKPRPCYNLTRDGFSLLVMGFTGEKAYKWKIEFIKAFNTMEAELKRLSVINYVNQIADLQDNISLQAKRHKYQINGYKSWIAVIDKANKFLRAELEKATTRQTDINVIALSKANERISEAYRIIGAVMAAAQGDEYFIKNMKGTQ